MRDTGALPRSPVAGSAGEQAHLLDLGDARNAGEHRREVEPAHRAAERPALPVRATVLRGQVGVQRAQRRVLDRLRPHVRAGRHPGHHRHALVERRLDDEPGADEPPLVQVVADPAQQLARRGPQVVERDAAQVVRHHPGHDEQPHRAGQGRRAGRRRTVRGGRQAGHPRRVRGDVAGEHLEVVGRHRPAARPQLERPAQLRVVHGLAVHAARGRVPVLDLGDVRDARLEHPDHAARHVAAPPAADPVGRHLQPRPERRHRAVVATARRRPAAPRARTGPRPPPGRAGSAGRPARSRRSRAPGPTTSARSPRAR